MSNRASDWFNQAIRDLEQAEASRIEGRHEWACLPLIRQPGRSTQIELIYPASSFAPFAASREQGTHAKPRSPSGHS